MPGSSASFAAPVLVLEARSFCPPFAQIIVFPQEQTYETRAKLCEHDATLVSTRRARMPRLSTDVAANDDALEAHGDHVGRGDQANPRGLSLPGCALSGTSTNVPQCSG